MRCAPAVWQIAAGSQFLAALAARPLPADIPYTSIATQFDEVIVPQPQSSHLEGAVNIILQDICPGRLVDHFTILADNLTYALLLDALGHPGEAADPQRLPAEICGGPLYMPATMTPDAAIAALGGVGAFGSQFVVENANGTDTEPRLKPYAVIR